jgi:uncharacterized protein YkwD
MACALALTLAVGAAASARPTPAGQVRRYDKNMLFYVNRARAAHHLPPLRQSNRLYRIAHSWAAHMARVRRIKDNPHGWHETARSCPRWHDYGENVAAQEGTDAHAIFELYMHDRGHRKNILAPYFTNIGISTIRDSRDGQTTEWNAMELAGNCS